MPPETARMPSASSAGGEGLRVRDDLAGVGLVLRGRALLERHGLGRDRVHERAALHHREDGLVERRRVLGLAHEHAAARAAQDLVRGEA